MAWFKRTDKGIKTSTAEKKDAPDGLWFKTPNGNIIHTRELKNNAYVCPDDDFHVKIGSKEYFEILFDNNKFTELDKDMKSGDPLKFSDTKPYTSRIAATIDKTELNDAVRTAYGKMNGLDLVVACMDFNFIGGSMGSVVGEKIARAIDHSLKNKVPFLMISKSGGARMMEAGFSLMQMAKTSAKLALLDQAAIPYISLLTDPTTGGVTASYAMLGDFNIAEPEALIGFAGPRVIRETIGKDLPKGFQSSEFVLEHGFLDFIIDRRQLKSRLTTLLNLLNN
ncbi:MAG TPA: acetyl-CoA carboxylase carboxyltransferase subunit beta [Algoriphagus sp.]|jgi:acetyl-CoA carboxylase carboxyl transferase subunit beta|uniref:Acetyl-coenzyme A carboxylase carboxyl transferase subunit beta n=1 Tax=Algoriphagus ornithinivorans TaxID=226506 RepID=A0A1I5EQV6_9BACT|nr:MULTISPECIES: acetyl-CoA carboxylase, carboxyltransferase subunit beta [Algoriphagus]MAL12375.1 acetyl-CoA carboxylase carboxyltransferase subunit beta [Algoriphagus sp.]MAN88656.1 acetyl-CoA carboxylase carboxyltransferase subunit beta [Algoriphagus sp.]QYH40227.1 acetyl-CoA carboxylase carboxyltransferase subunit beta [Algoriphagus sp. NBT04N3]SFO13800.1 acetyl-CoA carboxylase carboxyl transferase subunit beta [Algoriphagus ornithinivorans]HAD51757.1 acetyl-CoA carboxylase carboxyltransfe|tara:strand:+ start:151 stop:993 length:843 start_codon:yes stop_codon:yes gene_type:complete